MSATATLNGRPKRKQLADQLDRFDKQLSDQCNRLDSIIDALAEGLPGAVSDACREGARAAVKDAIIEIVTNPELRALLGSMRPEPIVAQEPTPAARRSNHWDRLKAKIAAARDSVRSGATNVKNAVVGRFNAIRQSVAAMSTAAGEAIPFRRILLVGLGVGVVVGISCWLLPQTVAASVSGVGAACTTIAVQAGAWLKRAARRFGLVT